MKRPVPWELREHAEPYNQLWDYLETQPESFGGIEIRQDPLEVDLYFSRDVGEHERTLRALFEPPYRDMIRVFKAPLSTQEALELTKELRTTMENVSRAEERREKRTGAQRRSFSWGPHLGRVSVVLPTGYEEVGADLLDRYGDQISVEYRDMYVRAMAR